MNIRRKSLIVVCVLLLVLCSALILAACTDNSTTETYQVTFNSNGGSAVTTQTIVSGGVVVKPADPTREGYTFDGWYKETECVNAWDFAADKVTANVTIYAKWTPVTVEEKFTVTFNSQGGSTVAPQSIVKDGKVTKPSDPTKDGFTFDGWFKEVECTTPWDFAVDTVTADTTLFAKWTAVEAKKYTVTFESNGGTPVEAYVDVVDGNTITKPTDPTREGHTFGGWYLDDGTFEENWRFTTDKVTDNVTLYAKWIVNTYTVTYDLDGGTGVEGVEADYNTSVTKPADPTKAGHTFAGWYTEKDGDVTWDFDTMKITDDTTIYAKWTINQYTVTFDSQGGTEVDNKEFKLDYGSKITKPADPTKDGFTFNAWCTDIECTTAWDFANDTVSDNITLYAKWIDDSADKFTVTFESNGGSAIEPYTNVLAGSTITVPTAPTKEHYVFDGWYLDDGIFTENWRFNRDTVTDNMTLYAKWKVATYTITFETNGGSEVTEARVDYDNLITRPGDPSKQGHTFGGWYKDTKCTVEWNFATDKVSGSLTLYAKWSINSYKVSYVTNSDDSKIDPTQADYDTTITKPTDPERTGYKFAGWYKDSGLETPWNFDTDLVKDNTILYAKWTIESYTVTFITNGGSTVDSQTVVYDKTVIEPTKVPTKVGHTFDAWYADKDFEYKWNFATNKISADTTIYARWTVNKYTVTFETNGGSAINPIEVEYNTLIPQLTSPIKEGERFVGWFNEPNLLTYWNFNTDKVTGDITLYAKWSSPIFFALSDDKEYYIVTGYDRTLLGYGSYAGIPATHENKPVKVIGTRAFAGAELKNVIIPEGIERIEDEAFSECRLLNELIMPDSVNYVGANFLSGCSLSTANFKLSPNVTVLSEGIFNSVMYTEYSVPSHITTIHTAAFDNANDMIKIVYIPSTVTTVESSICSSHKHVNFYVSFADESSKPLGWANDWFGSQNVVYNSTSLPILIDGIIYEIKGNNAIVALCASSDTIVNIPAQVTINNITYDVTKIKNNALSNLSAQAINIAEGITEIGDNNFCENNNLKAVWLPSSITNFGADAFQNSSSYPPYIYVFTAESSEPTYVQTFPSNFYGEIVCDSSVKLFIDNDWLYGIKYSNSAIALSYLGDKIVATIPDKANTNNTSHTVRIIGGECFRNNSSNSPINGVIFSQFIDQIDGSAFEMSEMAFVFMYYPPRNVAQYAFDYAYIWNTLYYYDEMDCPADKIIWGGRETYFNCKEPVLVDGVLYSHSDGNGTLVLGCESKMSHVVIPPNIPEFDGASPEIIVAHAFGKNDISSIDIKAPIIKIGFRAFYGCMKLNQIYLPATVTTIDTYSFIDCGIEKFYYQGTKIPSSFKNNWNRSAPVYLYSEEAPTTAPDGAHGYWHYDTDGKTILLWDIVT